MSVWSRGAHCFIWYSQRRRDKGRTKEREREACSGCTRSLHWSATLPCIITNRPNPPPSVFILHWITKRYEKEALLLYPKHTYMPYIYIRHIYMYINKYIYIYKQCSKSAHASTKGKVGVIQSGRRCCFTSRSKKDLPVARDKPLSDESSTYFIRSPFSLIFSLLLFFKKRSFFIPF